jgi:phage terminase large subunit GpA-like protein
VSVGKQELYGWLRQQPPLHEGDPVPRGFCHFPEYGEAHFQGLTAEELRMTLIRGFPVYRWEKIRPRNEQLDCRIMARGAAAAMALDRWPDSEWKARLAAISSSGEAPAAKGKAAKPAAPSAPAVEAAAPQPVAAAPAARGRKAAGWLGRSGRKAGKGWLGR